MGVDAFAVTFWGVRGSTPCNGEAIRRYGGNTSCVSVSVPGTDPILFDLGTGLRYFGEDPATQRPFRGTCLLSHLHWDHIQGLPFFAPVLCAGSELHVYAPVQADGSTVADVFDRAVRPPLFPVCLDQLPCRIAFYDVGDCEFELPGGVEVMARHIPHVGRTLGYRVTWRGRSVAYLSDHQEPPAGEPRFAAGALDLCDGVDLLIHDSQYTPAEFAAKPDWGHCTVEYAVAIAAEAGVRRLALFHHDPMRGDDDVDRLLAAARGAVDLEKLDIVAAAEGATLAVGG
jgi:phosphoribosyl 1,2-cyclic phosphodiesterase